MYQLQKTFKKLSPVNKCKFVLLLPIVCLATLVDKAIDLAEMIIRWTAHLVRWHWRELIVVAIAVACIVIPVVACVYIDQTVPRFRGNTVTQAEHYVYTNCHEMANNYIVAEDGAIRGLVRADERNIERIVSVVVEYDIPNKDILLQWLMEFKNGNFTHADAFHNHCWFYLDGEVGFAIDVKDRYK